MKKLILLLLALNILGAFIAGCSGGEKADDTGTTTGTGSDANADSE